MQFISLPSAAAPGLLQQPVFIPLQVAAKHANPHSIPSGSCKPPPLFLVKRPLRVVLGAFRLVVLFPD